MAMGFPAGGEPPGPAGAASPGEPRDEPRVDGLPGGQAGVVPGPPSTGDPRVDEAVRHLAGLAEKPVAEHPAVFEYVHDRLTQALGDLETSGQAVPGGQPGRPGGPGR